MGLFLFYVFFFGGQIFYHSNRNKTLIPDQWSWDRIFVGSIIRSDNAPNSNLFWLWGLCSLSLSSPRNLLLGFFLRLLPPYTLTPCHMLCWYHTHKWLFISLQTVQGQHKEYWWTFWAMETAPKGLDIYDHFICSYGKEKPILEAKPSSHPYMS